MSGATIYLSYNELMALRYALANYANMAAYYPEDNKEYKELCEQGLDSVNDKIYNRLKYGQKRNNYIPNRTVRETHKSS